MLSWELGLAVGAAFAAGFIDAIAGGGGMITLPSLILLGLPPQIAIATNKVVSTFGATASAVTFVRAKKVTPEVIKQAWYLALAGAILGAFAIGFFRSEAVKPAIAVVLLALLALFVFQPRLGMNSSYNGLMGKKKIGLMAGTLGIGFYDGILGPGTGTFFTMLMVRLLGLDFVTAAGNTKVLNWITNIAALTVFLIYGNPRFDLGLPMAFANLFGGYLGAKFAVVRGNLWVRRIVLIISGALVIRLFLP